MENLLIGQAQKINSIKGIFTKFIKSNKVKLLLTIISILFLTIYFILLFEFINIIKTI